MCLSLVVRFAAAIFIEGGGQFYIQKAGQFVLCDQTTIFLII